MKVRTGVIAAAGSGTRMYPVTIGYPKELLPIINKPAIHLIVEEFIDSGISKIVIVTGANPEPLRRQYDPSVLAKVADHSNVREFAKKLAGVEVLFEPQQGPYGNGTPLLVARSHIPADEGFIYAYGDDLVKSESPFARRLIDAHNRSGALVVATQEVPREEVVRYGMAKIEEKDGNMELLDVVEKPLL
ncbi:MAG TPA: sugar phosphate nucleotidyltransferase, partial [Blastocatellia bacterium]|nr:sugar phosphate nucleotidyltransferase [Blastocatellia bacterium]